MSTSLPNDQFETYYTEKLWALVPDIYRYQDGLGMPAGVLRSIIELLAHEAAIVRRSNDRVWEDQFIELCDEWAVPYIGALVATRMLSDKNPRGRRVDVAKTIYYRRRKGTPRVLEQLIFDISGWDGVLVEEFRRLGRARHGLDPFPAPLAGRLTGTMPGGWADLRLPDGSELADGPFDEYFHTPEMRQPRGTEGRFGIPKLAFYLYRLGFFEVLSAVPYQVPGHLLFTFDPSGRNIPLFNYRQRPDDWDEWHPAQEWELAAPIRCRLLGDAEYVITQATLDDIKQANPVLAATPAQAADIAKFFGFTFYDEASLRAVFAGYPSLKGFVSPGANNFFPLLLHYALVQTSGKYNLLANPDGSAISVTVPSYPQGVPAEQTTAGNLSLAAPQTNEALVIDPVNGRFFFTDPATNVTGASVTYYYGFSGPLGAGTYHRSDMSQAAPTTTLTGGGAIAPAALPATGILAFGDNMNYTPPAAVVSVTNLTVESADQKRPYLPLAQDWTFTGTSPQAVLLLDGLWVGSVVNKQCDVVLGGTFASVTIQNCTLDPGGDTTVSNDKILAIHLKVTGTIGQLCIDNCILGAVSILAGTGVVETLTVCDSIIQSTDGTTALEMDDGQTTLENVTVFGKVSVDHLQASGVAVTDTCTVQDVQHGCFRFSAAPAGSQVPRPYESLLYTGSSASWWNSQRFGDPNYGQLSDVAPARLLSGGDEGYEIGAFASLLNPFKQSDLEAKVQEYMPFGLIPVFIHQT
jgi:hypothetical protein